MLCHCAAHCRLTFVGIAIAASMSAGIIGTDITADETRAARADRSLGRRNGKIDIQRMFQDGLRHTAGTVEAKAGKIRSFQARIRTNAMVLTGSGECFADHETFLFGRLFSFRKIPLCFLIEIKEADDCHVRRTLQQRAKTLKGTDMFLDRIGFINEHWIIAQCRMICSDNPGQLPESFNDTALVRKTGLDVLSIRRDRYIP